MSPRPWRTAPRTALPTFRPAALLAFCLMVLPGCLLHPPKVDLASAASWKLARLNEDLREPGFERPKGAVIVRGRVAARYQGRRYGLVLALSPEGDDAAPSPGAEGAARGLALCLFEDPQPLSLAEPGALVTVAGFLDLASAPDNLILTHAELVGP